MDLSSWGPLAHLAGSWRGERGVDFAHSYSLGEAKETPYREECSFQPFGPVDNGTQVLYGLDYRMEAWPIGAPESFHMEVGYWLWDAERHLVMRCFMVPRGVTVLAGGEAAPDARSFSLHAEMGEETFGVLQNPYLMRSARAVRYDAEISVGEDGTTYSYAEDTVLEMRVQAGLFHHTDRNALTKV